MNTINPEIAKLGTLAYHTGIIIDHVKDLAVSMSEDEDNTWEKEIPGLEHCVRYLIWFKNQCEVSLGGFDE